MNDNPATFQHNDEIDLKDLLKKIIGVLSRGTKTIILSILLGAILGLAYFFNSSITYKSNMILSSEVLVLANVQGLLDPFNSLLEEGNFSLLSERLGIDEEMVAKIKEIEIKSVFEKETDNKEPVNYFEVTVTVTDNNILPQLQESIVRFLQNNEFVQKRVALKEDGLKTLIDRIDKEIAQIDSVKEKIGQSVPLSATSPNVVLMEPSNLYEQALKMVEKQQQYKMQLALVESFQIVQGFTPYEKPSSPSWIICLVTGLGGGLIIGFAILFFREMDRYVRS